MSLQRLLFVFVVLVIAVTLKVNCRSYNNGLVFYDVDTHLPYLPPTVSVSRGRSLASFKYSAKGSIWSTFGKPCDCAGAKCGCCAEIKVNRFRFDQKMCANVTFMMPKEETQLEIYLNEIPSAKYGISVKNPDPFCIPVMMPVPMAMCVQLSNIAIQDNNLNMCMDFIVRLASTDIFEMHFQCMQMGLDGLNYVDKNGQPVLPMNSQKGDALKENDSEEFYDEDNSLENEVETEEREEEANKVKPQTTDGDNAELNEIKQQQQRPGYASADDAETENENGNEVEAIETESEFILTTTTEAAAEAASQSTMNGIPINNQNESISVDNESNLSHELNEANNIENVTTTIDQQGEEEEEEEEEQEENENIDGEEEEVAEEVDDEEVDEEVEEGEEEGDDEIAAVHENVANAANEVNKESEMELAALQQLQQQQQQETNAPAPAAAAAAAENQLIDAITGTTIATATATIDASAFHNQLANANTAEGSQQIATITNDSNGIVDVDNGKKTNDGAANDAGDSNAPDNSDIVHEDNYDNEEDAAGEDEGDEEDNEDAADANDNVYDEEAEAQIQMEDAVEDDADDKLTSASSQSTNTDNVNASGTNGYNTLIATTTATTATLTDAMNAANMEISATNDAAINNTSTEATAASEAERQVVPQDNAVNSPHNNTVDVSKGAAAAVATLLAMNQNAFDSVQPADSDVDSFAFYRRLLGFV